MDNLDDKLRVLLQAVWKEDNQYFSMETGSYDPDGNTEGALRLIKQAFTDAGWVELRLAEVRPWKNTIKSLNKLTGSDVSLVDAYKPGLMTGQEFYDRFSTALVGYACLPVDVGSVDWDSGDVMRAAKKAAGLSNE